MLKPLIFILILVTLLAIGINLGLFDETIEETGIKSNLPLKRVTSTDSQKTDSSLKRVKVIKKQTYKKDDNLSNELMELLRVASIHFQRSEDIEAFKLYNEVIQKSQNSNDPKILKIFAEALFRKATLDNIYPHNDPDSAIEEYEIIIEKFNKSNNVELLKLYIEARLKKARLQSQDELLNTYDELIKRFEKDKEQRFDKEVEELKFSKSFILMGGDNAEEAIDILDSIIAKYQARGDKKLPEIVEDSILNNIELSIITDNDDEKYVELANKYLLENKDTAPLLDMLKIMKNAQDLDQHEAIEEWISKYKDYHFSDWDFSELSEWADKMENPEAQKRIKEYLEIFLRQKYVSQNRVTSQNGDLIFIKNEDGSTQAIKYTENTKEEQLTQSSEEYVENEEDSYETNPYINDYETYNNSYSDTYIGIEEPIYPNPYKELPNDPNDGVSHNYYEEVNPY